MQRLRTSKGGTAPLRGTPRESWRRHSRRWEWNTGAARPGDRRERRIHRAAGTRLAIRSQILRRGVGLLGLILTVAACAVERPRAVPVSLPPPTFLPPPIISRFGDWQGSGGGPRAWQHYGIDIRVPLGTPVLAAADGTVLRVGENRISGKLVTVSHADDLTTVYYHLDGISVRAGQTVRRGDVLGRAGRTGNATTPHLHFGVCRREAGRCGNRIDAGWDDPIRYWIEGSLCFVAGQPYAVSPVRLTYPLPCAS